VFAPGVPALVLKVGALFSPDRRYAVVSPFLGQIPENRWQWEDDRRVPGRRVLVPVDPKKAPPPLVLHDLSSGTKVGEFPGTVPLSLLGRLSPDGEYAVTQAWEEMPDLSKVKSFVLDVWRKGRPKVEGQIAPTGCVRWAEFLSPTRLALFQQEPDPALVVWDVSTRQVVSRIPTTIRRPQAAEPGGVADVRARIRRPSSAGSTADWAAYVPNASGGAVAPGGRFVAIGGPADVTVFDLEAGKEHGRFPIRGNAGIASFDALRFLTKPDRLVAKAGPNVTAWDLATGKLTHATPFESPPQARGSFENGRDGRLERVIRRFIEGGREAAPFGEPSAGGGLFVSVAHERETTAPEILKKIPYELAEFEVLYTRDVDDKLSQREEVPAFEPFEAVAARPAVAPGNREGLKANPPEPPAAWEAPPASDWTKPGPAGWLPAWPTAVAGDHAAVVRYEQVDKKVRQYGKRQRYFRMSWDRDDLATGKKAGPTVPLWPWANDPNLLSDDPFAHVPTPPPTTVAALTADGERLALVDPNEPHRVDVWDASGERTGFYAAPEGAVVDWLGWSADGKLLALSAGALTAWDAREAKAVWETDGGYRPPVEMARGGRWAAFHAGTHVDLVDAATGRCLGRCRAREDIASPRAFSLSPDARRLIVMTKKDPYTRSPDGAYEFYSGTVWDLATGAAESFPFGTRLANQFNDLHDARWIDPEHFAAFMTGLSVYDVRAKAMVAQFDVSEHTNGFAPVRPWYRTSPDGRIWLHARTGQKIDSPFAWMPVTLPEQAGPLFDPGRSYEEVARQPLRVEVDYQDATRSKRAAQSIADALAGRGYTIGDGKWVLRVASERSDQYVTLTRSGGGGELRIYNIRLNWWLTPPSGGPPVWTWKHEKMPLSGSRFIKGTKLEAVAPNQTLVNTEYDFGGRDPMTALTEEYLEKASRTPEVPGNIAGWGLLSGGRGFALPLSGTCKVAHPE
jgi:hypothetical protein